MITQKFTGHITKDGKLRAITVCYVSDGIHEGIAVKLLRTRIGVSLLELVVSITILGILAAGVVPLIRNTTIRSREIELHRNLRIIRIALDDYKKTFDKMPDGPNKSSKESGYPKDLNELVEGRDFGDLKAGKVKFLRRKIRNPLEPKISTDDKGGGG